MPERRIYWQRNNFMKKIIFSTVTLAGTIIGVGVFSLPYITFKVGFETILIYFLFLVPLVALVQVFFGRLVLETPDFKRLPGIVRVYLGKTGEKIAYFSTFFSLLGSLLAYLIVGGGFLKELLNPFFGGGNLLYTCFYFIFGSLLIFFGIKTIEKIELLSLILFFLVLIGIFFKGRILINSENLFLGSSFSHFKDLFLPYGPLLFSFWGASLIPEVEEMLKEKRKEISKVIISAILISALFYLFFIYLILGITGVSTTENALSGLKGKLGNDIFSLSLLMGILTTFTSFITLGLTLKKILWYDLKLKKTVSFLVASLLPFFLFLLGVKRFIPVVSFVGSICFGINGILILLMYHKKIAPKSFFPWLLILILLAGIFYEIIFHL